VSDVQEFTAPADGTYRIELWGASGGNAGPYTGGKGAYTGGYITLKKNQVLYVYVGGQGTNSIGGYNGGSAVATDQENYGASGGGATDVRLVGDNWDSFDSLKSRIMVAAGGGGANYRNVTSETDQKLYGSGNGGAGGGLWGYDGVSESFQSSNNVGYTSANFHSVGSGGTQVLGGTKNGYDNASTLVSSAITGGFGFGSTVEQSGGGGGWYTGSQSSNGGAGGGSSYISGHLGCQAINQNSVVNSISHSADSEYDSYIFTNTTMIDGEGYNWTSITQSTQKQSMPNNGFTTIDEGNVGDGFARITYLGL
ncbi:MAG: fimbrillin family protein, partial [Bacilli bacterium]|nr:fimbrillin family protein [Bacilli bacterium]